MVYELPANSKDRPVTTRLTAEEIATYEREGYLIIDRPIFPDPTFAALRDHVEATLAELPADARPEAMDVPHFTDPALFRWLFADAVLDLVEQLIGPDIALWSSHFIMRYIPTSVRFRDDIINRDGAMHQIYLARGRDRAGNTYADPERAYPELIANRLASLKKFH
jgi:hypothetical protein